MASGIITVIVGAALEKAKSTAMDNIQLMLGFPEQLDAMKGHVEAIEAVLDDADSKKTGTDSRRVLVWLKDVDRVSFEAEMVLAELLYESLRRQVLEPEVCSSFLFILESRIRDVYLSMMLGRRVQGINAKFEKFNSQIKTIGLVGRERPATNYVAANRETHSSVRRGVVVGRGEEESKIVNMLLSGSSSDNPSCPVLVVPIVGMGGLGKTTLAKLVYDNQQIKDRFRKRSWTCVSNKVDDNAVLKGILESLKEGKKNVGVSTRQAIVQAIQNELGEERFLFVFDDVWEDGYWWDKFLESLGGLNHASGSCCVLTTRLQNNSYSYSLGSFVLDKLSDDTCWSIISSKATIGKAEREECLNVYKEQILKKCQGLPLAANVIGGFLGSNDIKSWPSIMEDEVMKDVHGSVDDKIMEILRLSYDYLPSRCIKSCFVYCSVYHKDAEMDGDKLIEFWMAQGYLQEGVEGGKTMEEVGAGYLSILLQSSLLEKCYKKDSLRYQMRDLFSQKPEFRYQMHDLVHDLAESLSREKHVGGELRHFELGYNIFKYNWNANLMLAGIEEGDICDAMLSKCIHARVMHLHLSREIKILANNVGMLIHVRSLSISGDGIESLPESLCRLYNLQTLDLSRCYKLQCLPQGLSNLISLRHLHFFRGGDFKMPPNMGRLTSLQTLKFFNVGKENGRGVEELGSMDNLKGSLMICNLELVKGKEEASSANLIGKRNLTKLELNWDWTTERKGDEEVLEGLEPCPGLQELQISNYMGARCPGWLGNLSSLVSLQLFCCKNMTNLGNLSELEVLKLYGCWNMRELGYSGDVGFPKLKTLFISRCSQLSSVRTSFPVLEKLDVRGVQVSTARNVISKIPTNSLQELILFGVSGMTCLSDVIESSRLSSCLKKLEIVFCDELTEIPSSTLECCTCLESLIVSWCPELVSCPLNLQQTPCLSNIEISDCPKLFTRDACVLPRGFEHLTNLKALAIGPDNSQQSTVDWEGLRKGCSTTLQDLTIEGSCRAQLPQQLQDFSSLVGLGLSRFESLERLPGWLGKLTSLQRLRLVDCPKLEHLPTDAIRSLTNLQRLEIQRCPLLTETQGDEIKKALPNLKVFWSDYFHFVISTLTPHTTATNVWCVHVIMTRGDSSLLSLLHSTTCFRSQIVFTCFNRIIKT